MQMTRRRFPRFRVVVAFIAVAMAFSVFSSSAATLGGLGPDGLGGATGTTRQVSAVHLEWNRSAGNTPSQPHSLRLNAVDGETFATHDTVDVTAVGPDASTCSATTTVAESSTPVDLSFMTCGIPLWELRSVAITISGPRGVSTLESTVGALHGALAAFYGAVVQPDAPLTPRYTTVGNGPAEALATVSLGVQDATVEQLVGRRGVVVLFNAQGVPTSYDGVVGTRDSNQGLWAAVDPATSLPTVTADLRRLVPGGDLPATAAIAQFRMVLLQPQRLGAGQTSANQFAIATAGATVESSGEGPTEVGTAVEPVGLDERLKYTGKYTQKQDDITLRFCWEFTVKNTSKESVEWQVAFDTTKPPMWGLDPTIVDGNGVGTLHSIWSVETVAYEPTTGLWTLGGVDWNRVLKPNHSHTVGYCAQPEIPEVDASTFDEPVVSNVSGKDPNYVEFRVKVKSSSEFLVPWEAEVDFADYVCPASIGDGLAGQNAELTHIEGTRYRVRGTDNTYRFVSKKNKQVYVFASFHPVSDPFDPACS